MAGFRVARFGEFLTQRKRALVVDDFARYKRARVQLHGKGIVLRDVVLGSEIKTKQQQAARPGEMLVAEIDAKVGGFGIVPSEIDGAIVSSHYFLFEVNEQICLQAWLDWYIRSGLLEEQVKAQGSTNYAAIRAGDVLDYKLPLPSLAEQQRIVARIEALARRVEEGRGLRREAIAKVEALITSLHLHLSGTRNVKLDDILVLVEVRVPVQPDGKYPQVGLRSFGVGLFPKSATVGAETTYKHFNQLYAGAVVLSQVKGWEGAIAVCPASLVGWYASPEYRTFRCIPGVASPDYLAILLATPWFWRRLQDVTRGVGARRERTRPEHFLRMELPMPTLEGQQYAVNVLGKYDVLRLLQAETQKELDALMPSILARAFTGQL